MENNGTYRWSPEQSGGSQPNKKNSTDWKALWSAPWISSAVWASVPA